MYRKVVAGSGLAPSIQYDGSLPTYLLPGNVAAAEHVIGQSITSSLYLFLPLSPPPSLSKGHPLVESPQPLKGSGAESSRGLLVEPNLRDSDRGVARPEENAYLLAK